MIFRNRTQYRKMAVCWNLIAFDASLENTNNDQVDVNSMITDIISYQERFMKLSDEQKAGIFSGDLLQAKFINHICIEEGVGLQEQADTVALLREIQQNTNSLPSASKRQKTGERDKHLKRQLSHSAQETKNVYDAWTHLKTLSPIEDEDEGHGVAGLVDIDACIRETHRILMKEVLDKENTPAGQFSILERQTTYKGKTHTYPRYNKERDAEEAVQIVVDRFNALINEVKKLKDPGDRTYKMFKSAAYLLYNLITIHPFSDGNGRLCRLLGCYVLSVMFPFPSPIYNVCSPTEKSDYVDALIKARERNPSQPRELTRLMIESNWYVWKAFFDPEQ